MIQAFIDNRPTPAQVFTVYDAAFILEYSATSVKYLDENDNVVDILFPSQMETVKLREANACIALQAIGVDTTVLDEYILAAFMPEEEEISNA